jgi:hypothetical protein
LLDFVRVLHDDLLRHFYVLREGLRWRVLNFDFIFAIESVEIGTIRDIFALDFFEKKAAVFHGSK